MSKEVCIWVELNESGVNELLQSTSGVVEKVATNYVNGISGAKYKKGTRSGRPIGLCEIPKDSTENNDAIKKLFSIKKVFGND